MKTGFPNAVTPSKDESGKNPWSFKAPEYDDSRAVQAGCEYGVGHRNPVGHKDGVKQRVPTMPFGHVDTMDLRKNK
jgi:hypothetical protein